jgi:hypothetical protein
MAQIKDRGQYAQGEGRAHSKKSSGSHLDPQGEGRINGTGPSGSHLTTPHTQSKQSGSHLDVGPNVPGTDKTAVRGGGTVRGHDRTNPNAGKSKSGSKNAQHPNNTKTKR